MEHRIAISHASGIAAEAILEKLPESGIKPDSVFLLDREVNVGKRLAFADGHIGLEAQHEFDFSRCALLLMPEPDAELESAALSQGCMLVSHAIESQTPPLFMTNADTDPGISYSDTRLRLAGPELSCLLPVLLELNRLQPIEQLNLTLVRSAEFRGKPGVDELASQTINLLNAREAVASVFPEQIAFNFFPEAVDVRLQTDLNQFLGNISYSTMLQTLNVPVFHGFAAGVQLRFAAEVAFEACHKLLMSLENVDVKKASSGPISDCNQSFSCVLSHLEQAREQPSSLQFWMIADPMRYGLANNYVNVVDFLLKSFL
ncbi:MAG: hypothetical protein JSU67_08685 [Gammaproteobacteria bacterium]|nr:MAG: hypothetical protein EP300_02240 [Gammaproteobacteria bacterium]UCH41720.1 MAG: hypothetical protein JSU67_08685 [Gammaproteobacteria bacterium]